MKGYVCAKFVLVLNSKKENQHFYLERARKLLGILKYS
jgi:hypothetical protein